MKLIPQLPLFSFQEVEGKKCLIHTLSDTIVYIHKTGDEVPEELKRDSQCLTIKSPEDSNLSIAYITWIQSSKSKKECFKILEEALEWYKDHITVSKLFNDYQNINS